MLGNDLLVCFFDNAEHLAGMLPLGHFPRFVIDPIRKVWAVPPQLFDEIDDLGDLPLGEACQLQRDLLANIRQLIGAALRGQDQYQHDQTADRQSVVQPRKRRPVDRNVTDMAQEQIHPHPERHDADQPDDGTRPPQGSRPAIHDFLDSRRPQSMVGVELHDRLHGLGNVTRQRWGVRDRGFCACGLGNDNGRVSNHAETLVGYSDFCGILRVDRNLRQEATSLAVRSCL